ncbi:MAG: hypothetical protein KGD65_12720 [Candidatus Lokiarchaeota archaeon]|nr:hypothetical protein [Candidatus Lokiarchaeota archaeon]
MPALAHLGIGFATKRFAPQIPLWALLISSMVLDILSFIFISALWITHGLFMSVIWSIVAFLITALITIRLKTKKEQDNNSALWSKEIINISIVIGLLVFSHWVLDFIGWPMSVIDPNATGVPLLFDYAATIGLGVYSTWLGALIMDIGVFFVGLAVYLHYVKKVRKVK